MAPRSGLAAHCTYVLTSALPTVTQNLTINGNAATLERSTAPGTPAFTSLTVASGTLSLSKLNFTGGDGALLLTKTGNLTVNGGTFSQNQAPEGGAIDLNGAGNGSSVASITGATFSGNQATGTGEESGAGGAIYNGLNASKTVTKSTFTGNQAAQGGGAIFDFAVYGAHISNSTFTGNTAPDGGAIVNDPIGGESLSQVTIKGNSATGDGGGIYSNLASISVANSVISGNQAGQNGGGIYQEELEDRVGVDLTGTRVTQNTAANGGGVYNDASVADFTGSTLCDNSASSDGGGIYDNGGPRGPGDYAVNLGTSTVSTNTAGAQGGGIYNAGNAAEGDVTATSSKIVHNTAAGGGGIYDVPSPYTTVTLTNSPVLYNKVDNCEPLGSITGCTH